MKNILLITTFYPNQLRPGTPVCHYFAKEWKSMGYNIIVLHYRSMFPMIYTKVARLFPRLALKFVGNHVETDINSEIVHYFHEDIPVYSIPIFKYFPHGKYSDKTINFHIQLIKEILSSKAFEPNYILGHFYNPTIPLLLGLRKVFPSAKTSITLHESDTRVLKRILKNPSILNESLNLICGRNRTILESYISNYGAPRNSFVCYSGVPKKYIEAPYNRKYDNVLQTYIYVGQFITRKYPDIVIKALNQVSSNGDFKLIYVGEKELLYHNIYTYVKEHQLENSVEFKGKISRDELIRCYDNSDVFVMISRGEVFGLVYLEAMSRGCITIAARGEGVDGIIIHGENGFLCEAGNISELSQIIQHVTNLPLMEKVRISENARKTALELSDYNVAKNYIEALINA